jgi:hypothetical protein
LTVHSQPISARDSTPEPYIPLGASSGAKKGKKKSERAVAAVLNGEVNEDDRTFELTSKSKAHRKIRVNPKIYGGDIMRPRSVAKQCADIKAFYYFSNWPWTKNLMVPSLI